MATEPRDEESLINIISKEISETFDLWFTLTHEEIMRPKRTTMGILPFICKKEISMNKWDNRFIELAEHISAWSKDPSTQVGAVIAKGNRVISLGFNGFPMGVNDLPERLDDRDMKLQMTLHAEPNAIMFAKQDLSGCSIYTWPFPPCCRCAAQIIQMGITKVFAPKPDEALASRWKQELDIASAMFEESGVTLCLVD